MSGLRILHLYRPRLPAPRAQSIQVLSTCHALASLGHEVTLLADAPVDNMPVDQLPTPEEVFDFYGLEPVDGLDLKLSPTAQPGPQSFWFRKHALWWVVQSTRHHPGRSVILARAKRYFDEYTILPFGPPVVLESHELDSQLAAEAGQPTKAILKLERRLLERAAGLVTNCQGTMDLMTQVHGDALPPNRAVVRNATAAWRVRDHLPRPERVIGYAGSLRPFKGLKTLVEAAGGLPSGTSLELMGGSEAEREALGPLPDAVRATPSRPPWSVPDHIAGWHAAVVPLDDNLFGRSLCNPLKLWDYLAVGLPLVAADLPTLREVLAPEQAFWYRPGDPESLRAAMAKALDRPWDTRMRRRRLRSWRQRAEELVPVLEAALR
ncbi:MAG: glycosyltransferase [Alphaproteobacteria bacterium]|nr:glycosyltransferase [Alphaproteobacteria bacterium]